MVIVIPEGFSVYHPTKQPPVLLALDASNTLNALDQLYYVTETWQPHMPGFVPNGIPRADVINRTMEGRHYLWFPAVLLITLLGCVLPPSACERKEKASWIITNAPVSRMPT
jgi:hypothetical protein